MKKITITTTGLSLLEVKKKYPDYFFLQTWYENEPFAEEHPAAGVYEIIFSNFLNKLTFKEQQEKIPKGFEIMHSAVLAEACCIHYKATGERLLAKYYLRTSSVDSDGSRVYVGIFGDRGLRVGHCWDDDRGDGLGLASARKLESEAIERPIPALEEKEGITLLERLQALEAWRNEVKDQLLTNFK